jgi:hypothetical protein
MIYNKTLSEINILKNDVDIWINKQIRIFVSIQMIGSLQTLIAHVSHMNTNFAYIQCTIKCI